MRRTVFFSLIMLILPQLVQSQAVDNQQFSTVIIESEPNDQNNLQIITPVLLRNNNLYQNFDKNNSSFWNHSASNFFSSLILPGSAQAANKNWIRAGLFAAIEVVSIYMIVDFRNRGASGERRYEQFADENWSVVQYSQWLIDYHEVHGIQNPYLQDLENMIQEHEAAFTPDVDWNKVDLTVLRDVERNTPYVTTDDFDASNFSHVLPDYGSQQYYELIAKYYQYQAGWRDYNNFHNSLGHTGNLFNERYLIDRNGAFASPMFYKGVDLSEQFNDDFRKSRHFTSLLIANHFISAFDAYFTLKLKQNRIQATSSVLPGQQLNIRYSF